MPLLESKELAKKLFSSAEMFNARLALDRHKVRADSENKKSANFFMEVILIILVSLCFLKTRNFKKKIVGSENFQQGYNSLRI